MEIVGKVIQVLPLQQGVSSRTGNPWTIKTFIIETQENYPRKVAIEVFGDDRIKANPCEEGQLVTVSFDLESREFNGRWYTSVRAWKIEQGIVAPVATAGVQTNVAPQPVAPAQPAPANTDPFIATDESSDLPF